MLFADPPRVDPTSIVSRYRSSRDYIQFFLGRNPRDAEEILELSRNPRSEIPDAILRSDEFRILQCDAIMFERFPADRFGTICDSTHFNQLRQAGEPGPTDASGWGSVVIASMANRSFWDRACAEKPDGLLDAFINVCAAAAPSRSSQPDHGVERLRFSNAHCLFIAYTAGTSRRWRPLESLELSDDLGKVEPLHAIVGEDGASFRSIGDDPQLLLCGALRPGLYLINIDATFQSPPDGRSDPGARLYPDYGGGYSEADAIAIAHRGDLLCLAGFLFVRRPMKSLRFDPSVFGCRVHFNQLSICEIVGSAR